MINATILADSINSIGTRLTTWKLTYPRFIHAEFMTHRDFSRNAASSRAIPLKQTIQSIQDNPALPVWWGSTQKGMQSGPQLEGEPLQYSKNIWDEARQDAIGWVREADKYGLHKSLTNRLLEPWSHITVIATATDHRNFFALRAHKDAMPEFQVLAYRMLDCYLTNQPRQTKQGEWHIPFSNTEAIDWKLSTMDQIRLATARCCWVSYNKPDKVIGENTTLEDAFKRHDDSVKVGHWSPFEHCAQDMGNEPHITSNFDTGTKYSYSGWLQYRKLFLQERKTAVNLNEILANRPEWTKTAGL